MRPLVALALVLQAATCARTAPAAGPAPEGRPTASAPATPEAAPPPTLEVSVETPSGNRPRVRAEVARSEPERTRGLMFRRSLAPDAGMLFVMPHDHDWTFWMKNTLVPLDLIFADATGRVVGVVEDARPLDETSRGVGRPSRYVLEVNGGWCRRNGVGEGSRLVLPEGLGP